MHQRPVQSNPTAFSDVHRAPGHADRMPNLAAGVLTSILYVLFAVLIWRSFLTVPVDQQEPEIAAAVLPDIPKSKPSIPPPFPVRLVRPRLVSITLPTFIIASANSPVPARLPPTAAETSWIAGSGMTGNGTGSGGQSGSAASASTEVDLPVACLDSAWLHAITKRVMAFINYPSVARRSHTTGVVILHFVVRRTGVLDLVEVSRSSGNRAIDDAASEGMNLAQPLPPIPDRMHTDRVDEHFEVTFGAKPIPEKRLMRLCEG